MPLVTRGAALAGSTLPTAKPNWPVYELAHKPVNSTKQTRLRQKLLELGLGAYGLVQRVEICHDQETENC